MALDTHRCFVALLIVLILSCSNLCRASLPQFYVPQDGNADQRRGQLIQAFEDAFLMAKVAAVTFDPCEEVFLRYFRPIEAPFVKNVFQTIANIPLNLDLDSQNVIDILSSAAVAEELQPKFANLELAWGNHPSLPERYQDCGKEVANGGGGNVAAFLFIDPMVLGDSALISICDLTWEFPTLKEVFSPPASGRNAQGNPLPGYTCEGLGDRDTDWMSCPGGMLLHELMHWTALLEDVPGYSDLIDENSDGFPQIVDFWGPDPPDGYGPFNAPKLKYLGPYVAIQNADSYLWYAQSKYWSWKCGRSFGPATSADDDTRRLGERVIQGEPEIGEG